VIVLIAVIAIEDEVDTSLRGGEQFSQNMRGLHRKFDGNLKICMIVSHDVV
jgi:hypothetical protein